MEERGQTLPVRSEAALAYAGGPFFRNGIVDDNENWDKRMIGYRLKRALIAETYAAKHH